jgi:hypothetical protein
MLSCLSGYQFQSEGYAAFDVTLRADSAHVSSGLYLMNEVCFVSLNHFGRTSTMNFSWLCTLKLRPCGIHEAMWMPPSASKLVSIAWSFTGNFCSAIRMASSFTFAAMARSAGRPSEIRLETMDDLLCPLNRRFAIPEQ